MVPEGAMIVRGIVLIRDVLVTDDVHVDDILFVVGRDGGATGPGQRLLIFCSFKLRKEEST